MTKKLFESIKNNYYLFEFFDYNEIPSHKVPSNEDFDVFTNDIIITPPTKKNFWRIKENKRDFQQAKVTEEEYLKRYAIPNFQVQHLRNIIVIEESEDKVSLKIFEYSRTRRVGVVYFKVTTLCRFVTYSKKKNLIYSGFIRDYHKKRKCIKVCKVANPCSSVLSNILGYENNYQTILLSKIFIDAVTGKFTSSLSPDTQLHKYSLEKRGVKLSDNWEVFRKTPYQPKLKDFKKNDFKYIDSIMSKFNLSGDKVRKTLHILDKGFDCNWFIFLLNFMGQKFILSRPISELKNIFENDSYTPPSDLLEGLGDSEKKNFYYCAILCCQNKISSSTLYDHIQFMSLLKNYEKIKWRSKTYEEFTQEHMDWSDRYSFYTTGKYYRTYNLDFENEVIKQFHFQNNLYFPVLLRDSTEYNMESAIQSNCVKTYINKPYNFIISLRKNSSTSDERVTLEYSVYYLNDKLNVKRIQSLGRFNNRMTIEFEAAAEILDTRVQYLFKDGKFKLPDLKVIRGGEERFTKAIVQRTLTSNWGDNQYNIVWENESITNINTNYTPQINGLIQDLNLI